MTLSLELMTDTLPVGFAELEADAKTDGHGDLTRLAVEFAQSPAIFHGIFACHLDGKFAGIGDYRRACPGIAVDMADAAALRASQIWMAQGCAPLRTPRSSGERFHCYGTCRNEGAGPVLGGNWIPPSCRLRLVALNNNV
jgi:hypothetical protein